jgi:hypothetical protein
MMVALLGDMSWAQMPFAQSLGVESAQRRVVVVVEKQNVPLGQQVGLE